MFTGLSDREPSRAAGSSRGGYRPTSHRARRVGTGQARHCEVRVSGVRPTGDGRPAHPVPAAGEATAAGTRNPPLLTTGLPGARRACPVGRWHGTPPSPRSPGTDSWYIAPVQTSGDPHVQTHAV